MEKGTDKVRAYYDKWTARYLQIYGDVIQAFRPRGTEDLLNYIIDSAGLRWGMKVLDAGCGVAGPAIYFSRHLHLKVTGITISPEQVKVAREKIKEAGLAKRVEVLEGDYHQLGKLLPGRKFDGILFLESLGHAIEPDTVIKEASSLVRDGGFIYIKDFFRKIPDDPLSRQKVDRVIGNMNKHYEYNTLELEPLLKSLRRNSMEIDFIRKFAFKDDVSIRAEFEEKAGIDVFEGMEEFAPAEWLEIRCIKTRI